MLARKHRWYAIGITILVLACLAIVIPHHSTLNGRINGTQVPNGTLGETGGSKGVDGAATLEKGGIIRYSILFVRCGHTSTVEESVPPYLENASLEDIVRTFSNWQVKVFEPSLVELTLVKEDLCPDDQNHRFITIKDGYVAVYIGRLPLELKEIRREIPESILSQTDRIRLEQGIVVKAGPGQHRDDQVELLLEGLKE